MNPDEPRFSTDPETIPCPQCGAILEFVQDMDHQLELPYYVIRKGGSLFHAKRLVPGNEPVLKCPTCKPRVFASGQADEVG